MDPSLPADRNEQIQQRLDEVVDLLQEEHTSFLDRACADHHELRRERASLLQKDKEAHGFNLHTTKKTVT